MNIIYREIDTAIEDAICAQYGNWVHDYHCLMRGDGCYLVAAMDGDVVAGFAAVHPAQWIVPLEQYSDAFIEVIEVAESYRRHGIGSTLVGKLEKFAKSYGYYQIRAWSSCDKVEALNMWRKMNYCMCPAAMLGQSVRKCCENQQIAGYYYAKLLNTKQSDSMKCPYCGSEMEKGYIQCRDGVVWRKKKSAVSALSMIAPDAILLGTPDGNPFGGGYVVTYHCADCKKFIVDTENGNHTD